MTKPRHSPPRIENEELLQILKKARDGVNKFSGMHPARSGYHMMSKAVIQSIDELAFVITGKKSYFGYEDHTAAPPPHYRPGE